MALVGLKSHPYYAGGEGGRGWWRAGLWPKHGRCDRPLVRILRPLCANAVYGSNHTANGIAKMAKERTSHKELIEPAIEDKKSTKLQKLAIRWGGHSVILENGFTAVPRSFLKYAAELKPFSLGPAEMSFVLNLMYFKWDARAPFPSYKTLADRMGISVQYARDIARKLERKGFLTRTVRRGLPNQFDLQPLFDALARHVEAEMAAGREKKRQKLIVV